MFRSSQTAQYIQFLMEKGRTNIDALSTENLEEMTYKLIREQPTKYLPKLEEYDLGREMIFMLAGWMETGDEVVGERILERMRELAVKAFTPIIKHELESYVRREEAACRIAKQDRSHLSFADAKQRI